MVKRIGDLTLRYEGKQGNGPKCYDFGRLDARNTQGPGVPDDSRGEKRSPLRQHREWMFIRIVNVGSRVIPCGDVWCWVVDDGLDRTTEFHTAHMIHSIPRSITGR